MNRADKRRRGKLSKIKSKKPFGEPPGQSLNRQNFLKQAIKHYSDGQLPEAEKICIQMLERDPDNPVNFRLLGMISLQMKNYEDAENFLEKSLSLNPSQHEVLNDLGLVLENMGRLDEARNKYQNSLSIHSNYAPGYNNLGRVLHSLGKPDEAISQYKKAMAIDPAFYQAHNNLGNALHEQGQLEEAVQNYEKSIALNPGYDKPYNNLGNTLQSLGLLDNAIKRYQEAISINPSYAEAYTNLGSALTKQERTGEAMVCFQKATAIDPDNPESLIGIANLFDGLGRLDESVKFYQKSVHADPNHGVAQYNLGNALKKLGRLAESEDHFRKALEIESDNPEAYNNLGNVLKGLERFDEAITVFNEVIEKNPTNPESYNNLGLIFKEQRRFDEAIQCCQQSLGLSPHYPDARANLGFLQLITQDFQTGWANYDWRWKVGNPHPYFRDHEASLWTGNSIPGERLLVWGEQGIGDTILFSSMLFEFLETHSDATFECDERLIPVLSRSIPSVAFIAPPTETTAETTLAEFDVHIPVGNLGRWLRPDLPSFPTRQSYLVPDHEQRHQLRKLYLEQGNDRLVGISWMSKGSQYGDSKSMTLEDLRPLFEQTGVTFVDLQYGDTVDERSSFDTGTATGIFHDETVDQMVDLDIFISQIAALDLVITISNTTAHIAGALGVPTILMLGAVPIWYWSTERNDSPWYPSLKIIRQQTRGVWEEVVEETRQELGSFMDRDRD